MRLAIVIPKAGTYLRRTINPGSAVVAMAPIGKRVECWYEGNIYNAVNLREFFERVSVAAHRVVTRAPTVAREVVDAGEVDVVAWFDTARWCIDEVVDEAVLLDWSKEDMHRLLGVRLPEDALPSWDDAARAAEKAVRVENDRGAPWISFRTRAGQVLHFNPMLKSVEIDGASPAPSAPAVVSMSSRTLHEEYAMTCRWTGGAAYGDALWTQDLAEDEEPDWRFPGEMLVVEVRCNGKIVGSADFSYLCSGHGGRLACFNVFVDEGRRRQGIATAMYDLAGETFGDDVMPYPGNEGGAISDFWIDRLKHDPDLLAQCGDDIGGAARLRS